MYQLSLFCNAAFQSGLQRISPLTLTRDSVFQIVPRQGACDSDFPQWYNNNNAAEMSDSGRQCLSKKKRSEPKSLVGCDKCIAPEKL